MSRMVNGWTASAVVANAQKTIAHRARVDTNGRNVRRRWITDARSIETRGRFKGSASEQAIEVVVEREEGEPEEQRHAEALPYFHRPFRHRTSLHDFGEIIHQVTPIQQGNRQEIEHPEAHAHQR